MTDMNPILPPLFFLKGKRAIITGAASGIGAEIARQFARAGAVCILTDTNAEGLSVILDEIGAAAGHASRLLDVTDFERCESLAADLENAEEVPDILVNNAGIGTVGTILTTSPDAFDNLYAVNVRGVFNVSRAFLPGMIRRGGGNVINMASIGGVVGIRDRLAYCTTKFAVVGLTKSMALDHATDGIRVNCICPGRVETPFVQARIAEYPDPEAARREMSATQLAGRMVRPDEVAAAAVYLASDAAAMITGTTFMIDSGWSAGK